MNIVKTRRRQFVEIQGTAEDAPFSPTSSSGPRWPPLDKGHSGADRHPAQGPGRGALSSKAAGRRPEGQPGTRAAGRRPARGG